MVQKGILRAGNIQSIGYKDVFNFWKFVELFFYYLCTSLYIRLQQDFLLNYNLLGVLKSDHFAQKCISGLILGGNLSVCSDGNFHQDHSVACGIYI